MKILKNKKELEHLLVQIREKRVQICLIPKMGSILRRTSFTCKEIKSK